MNTVQIYCPHCGVTINLPPQLEILHEAHKSGGGYVAFGDPNRQLPCPECKRGIRTGDIVEGKHDAKPAGWVGILVAAGWFGIMAIGLYSCLQRR